MKYCGRSRSSRPKTDSLSSLNSWVELYRQWYMAKSRRLQSDRQIQSSTRRKSVIDNNSSTGRPASSFIQGVPDGRSRNIPNIWGVVDQMLLISDCILGKFDVWKPRSSLGHQTSVFSRKVEWLRPWETWGNSGESDGIRGMFNWTFGAKKSNKIARTTEFGSTNSMASPLPNQEREESTDTPNWATWSWYFSNKRSKKKSGFKSKFLLYSLYTIICLYFWHLE